MIMFKDNHGGIRTSVALAKRIGGFSSKVEVISSQTINKYSINNRMNQLQVEYQTLQDAIEAAEAGADIVIF